jgi:hypothetical protein
LLAGPYPPGYGLCLTVAAGGQTVLAPIAPGLIRPVSITEYRPLSPSEQVILAHPEPCVLALDGEREIEMKPNTITRLRLTPNGPFVVNARKAIALGVRAGRFLRRS